MSQRKIKNKRGTGGNKREWKWGEKRLAKRENYFYVWCYIWFTAVRNSETQNPYSYKANIKRGGFIAGQSTSHKADTGATHELSSTSPKTEWWYWLTEGTCSIIRVSNYYEIYCSWSSPYQIQYLWHRTSTIKSPFHFMYKATFRPSCKAGVPNLFQTWGIHPCLTTQGPQGYKWGKLTGTSWQFTKMLMTYYYKHTQILLNNFPSKNQSLVIYLLLLWLQ